MTYDIYIYSMVLTVLIHIQYNEYTYILYNIYIYIYYDINRFAIS